MAAFAYRNAESRHHREKFMKRTKEAPMWLEMRVLAANLSGSLHDIRGKEKTLHSVYSMTSYGASQELGVRLRREGSSGIVYDSVRRKDGECVAA